VYGILTSIKRLTRDCLHVLNHRFLDWTKPTSSSFISGTLTDITRKKSELVAENALLCQQLIILRRHVKRPTCTRADRMLLVPLARMVRTWKQALFIVQENDASALASPGLQALLEIHVQSSFCQTKDLRRDRDFDQGDGSEKSFTLVVLLRPSRQVLVVFLDEGNKKIDVRLVASELLPGRAKMFPQA